MSPDDFADWVSFMKRSRNWSKRRCARELECSANSIDVWMRKGAPRHVALACTALAMGWPAWTLGLPGNYGTDRD